VDRIQIGDGKAGPITKQVAEEYLGIAHGLRPDRYGWLTHVNVNTNQPVPV
jgi:branched-chain amino acid aminotransferase